MQLRYKLSAKYRLAYVLPAHAIAANVVLHEVLEAWLSRRVLARRAGHRVGRQLLSPPRGLRRWGGGVGAGARGASGGGSCRNGGGGGSGGGGGGGRGKAI